MTESAFVNQNRERWEEYKEMVSSTGRYSPDELGRAYLQLSGDLAYSQATFPHSRITDWLGALTLQMHHILYRRQPGRWKEFLRFITHDVPVSCYYSRRFIIAALVLIAFGYMLGVIGQALDHDFFRSFFGHSYYNTTMYNIKEGNPFGIYASESPWAMFWDIAVNNILVSLRVFVGSLLTPLVSVAIGLYNGIMLGVFDCFFFQKDLGLDALIVPNEHGALEIPAIILSLAAGMRLCMGWLFPGTLRRRDAFRRDAGQSMMIMLAVVPILVVAAFIESYITRHQEWPMALRLTITLSGLLFIVYYCWVLPARVARKDKEAQSTKQPNN